MKNWNTISTVLLALTLLTACNTGEGTYGNPLQGDPAADGQNGSYTAMVAVQDRLYYVDFSNLYTSDISDPANVKVLDQKLVGENVETIFFRNGLLFIGSGPALLIYQLDADGIPFRLSETSYGAFDPQFVPCDPVVADQNFAYATLSSVNFSLLGIGCARPEPINQLRIYGLADITNPELVSSTELVNPKGLALDGNTLFVCDSQAGLKIFDVTDRTNPVLRQAFEDLHTFDVIARDGLLVVTGPTLIAQYDYSDLNNIVRISTFTI